MQKLTVTVITRDEEANIAAALDSVRWADEIIVVDSQSTDATVAIAHRFTDKVTVRPWPGYAAQKNFAAEQASHDWILSLDADERVSPALATEVRALMDGTPSATGYRIPRVTNHLGRWIRSTDWYPDHQLRLYDRRRARWTGRLVHESVTAEGPVGRLRGELQHYAYRDIAHHLQTMDRYTTLAARQMYADGRRATWVDVLVTPRLTFFRNYILRGGFRDGMAGLVISAMNSYYVGLKFAKLWELCSPSTSTPHAAGAADKTRSS
ncbi:MAG: glycosyltransferase family 2 protein [Acidobacteria bacterium]|nr:glycosyltransferase family 2 protein [Acidobacteriota bacterium]